LGYEIYAGAVAALGMVFKPFHHDIYNLFVRHSLAWTGALKYG
jgi:hypothetical protein